MTLNDIARLIEQSPMPEPERTLIASLLREHPLLCAVWAIIAVGAFAWAIAFRVGGQP